MSNLIKHLATAAALLMSVSCVTAIDDVTDFASGKKKKLDFDILVTRDGEVVSTDRSGVMTRGSVDMGEKFATMDPNKPFGLVGIDFEQGSLLIDNAKVGVGSENELFAGYETLEERMRDSHRYYSVPDDIEIGKQCVEVIYDVEPFEVEGYKYSGQKGLVAKYMLYGLLPDNIFVYGNNIPSTWAWTWGTCIGRLLSLPR